MREVIVAGLEPDKAAQVKMLLETRGWVVKEGEYAPGAASSTVFLTSMVKDIPEGVKVLVSGESLSKEATPDAILDQIGPLENARQDEKPKEEVPPNDEDDEDAEPPEDTEAVKLRQAQEEADRQKLAAEQAARVQERKQRQSAMLLS